MADAGAVDGMVDEWSAPIGGCGDGFQDASAEGQRASEFFGVGFKAGHESAVLIDEDKEEEGASGKSGEMPFLRGERA